MGPIRLVSCIVRERKNIKNNNLKKQNNMKTTKRFLLTLAAILGMTGTWAQDTEEVAATKTANNNEWTPTMPAGDVELQYRV